MSQTCRSRGYDFSIDFRQKIQREPKLKHPKPSVVVRSSSSHRDWWRRLGLGLWQPFPHRRKKISAWHPWENPWGVQLRDFFGAKRFNMVQRFRARGNLDCLSAHAGCY